MTILLIFLALIVLAALALAAQLLRSETGSERGLAELNRALTPGRDYEQMLRLFEDRDILPVAPKRLAAARGALLRKYLRMLRGDFLTAWVVCRLLAPIRTESDPAPRLFGYWLSFHCLFTAVWFKTYTGPRSQAVCQVNRLLRDFSELRRRSTALMQLDAGLAANARPATRIRI